MQLHALTATEIVRAIAAGKTTATAVAESCLHHIAAREPEVGAWEIDHHWDKISDTLKNGRLQYGMNCTFADYQAARSEAERLRLRQDDVFRDFDLMLTPAAAGEAPVGLNKTGTAIFCAIWTTCHVPSMTLPLFEGEHGLPVGVQCVARRNADRALFAAGQWVIAQY